MHPLFAITSDLVWRIIVSHLDYCNHLLLFSYYRSFCFLLISRTKTSIHFWNKNLTILLLNILWWFLSSFRIKSKVLGMISEAIYDLTSAQFSIFTFYFACFNVTVLNLPRAHSSIPPSNFLLIYPDWSLASCFLRAFCNPPHWD